MSVIDQKRIAKNTMLLYVRIGLIMLVSLYTSRVVLDALGEIDFGIYNAVGGIVLMFSFLCSTMSTSCQRFYSYETGRNDLERLQQTFSLCFMVFVVIVIVVVVLAETVGLWLLDSKMNVVDRSDAAMWVFQCSVLLFVFTIVRTPYMGMVIAKEKMKVFAYLSVVEVFGNLAIAILIQHYGGDRLVLYAVLMMLVNMLVSLFYIVYCHSFYKECRLRFYWNKSRFMEMLGFAGWNMIGSLSGLCKSHGLNLLLNIFFGPAVNAARGLAYKVFATMQTFVDNFFMAVRPQLIKSYSSGDVDGMLKLVCQSSKFSYFLMFAIALPLFLETPVLLDAWLKNVPDYTVLFTRLVIVNGLIEVLVNPLASSMQAYGKIRNYQLVCGGFILTILPISYLLLKLGFPAETVFYVSIVVCALAILARLAFVRRCVGLSLKDYFRTAFVPMIMISVISIPVPVCIEMMVGGVLPRFIAVVASSLLVTALSVYFVGLTPTERKHTNNAMLNLKNKIFGSKCNYE